MNAKTMNQIAAMKSQTFGVEIEMYNIRRDVAAGVISDFFYGDDHHYRRAGGVYDKHVVTAPDGRQWTCESDASIIGRNGYTRSADCCEFVTPILKYEDLETLQEIVRRLRKAGGRSNPKHECGVHIHIGANGHDASTLRNLANLMRSRESLLVKAINVDPARARWCKTIDQRFVDQLNQKKPKTMNELCNIWYRSQGSSPVSGPSDHYNQTRYHILNYHAVFSKGTIEFRCFQFRNKTADSKGGLHAGELKSYIQLCLALSQMSKQVRSCSAIEPQHDNEKFAMRTWLIRLGFVGDEFKTAREILTKNLDGDCSFRFNNRADYAAPAAPAGADAVVA